jgi:hypothetical protein
MEQKQREQRVMQIRVRKEARMNTQGTRRLRDGREVDIGRNDGLRKVCRCGRNKWSKCPHPWHFSFQWGGEHYRFSLERHLGKKLTKAEADVEAERLRTAIRSGEFQAAQDRAHQPKPQESAPATFRQFADDWMRDAGISSFGLATTILDSSSFARSFFRERNRR